MPELDLTPDPTHTPDKGAAASPLPAHIDHYDILGRLGEGGMGEVYLARDRRLGRQVALKMLAGRYTEDAGLRERFLSEARAVSALEHPHICRLYDVGEWENRPYFTMERLRGETLRDRLKRGPLSAVEIRCIGAEVAEALAAAHERGILHCDIKPSNLFLTTDSGAKVMDFGIARRLHSVSMMSKPGSDDSTISGTLPRGVSPAGTPFYMSPEQVRGEPLDGRADQFSLGSVLYEMASGRTPFHAPSVVEIYAVILREKPAPLTIADTALAATIERALAKDRAQRFPSAAELAATLRSGIPPTPAPGAPEGWWQGKTLWLGGAAAVLAVAALLWALRPPGKAPIPILTPLVSNAGDKDAPSLSPTGDRVVFAWTGDNGNNVDVYVKMAAGGPPLRVTSNPLTDTNPVWSPDGQRLAFVRTGAAGVGTENGYYIVPALGGEERKVAVSNYVPNMNGGSNMAWSPDGRNLIFCDKRTPDSPPGMFSVDVESHAVKTIIEGRGYVANPVFSPDGRMLAYTRGPGFISHDLFVMDMKSGASHQLTRELRSIGGLAWTPDGSSIIFSSNRLGLFALWRIDVAGGDPQRLTVGAADAVSPSIARSGSRMSYLSRRLNINLWRYPLDVPGNPQRLVSSTRISTEPDYSPDGSRIVFASERSGSWEIWTTRADGSQPLQLTNMPGQQSASPRWSPDSQTIVFDTRFEGHADLAMIGAQGEGMRRLTTDKSDEFLPRFSRDGKSIYFFSNRSGTTQLWRMPAPSEPAAPPVQISVKGLSDAVESEDRKYLYIARRYKLWRMPIDAKEEQGIEEVLPKIFWRDFALVPGGVIYATGWTNLIQTIERMDWATKQKKKIMEIGPRPNLFGPFVVSPDRKWLLTDRVDQQNIEIMMVDNFN
jgi:Tol biopolymer transport system component